MRFSVTSLSLVLLACGCSSGSGGNGGGNNGNRPPPQQEPVYQVAVVADPAMSGGGCASPLFAPADLAEPIYATSIDLAVHLAATGFVGESEPMFVFPRHLDEGGPTLSLDSGLQLTDDIRFEIGTDAAGMFVGVRFKGQPVIGPDSLSHESEFVNFSQSVAPLDDQEFIAHIDSIEPLPVWEQETHLGGDRVQIVGYFCLGDLVFTPVQ